MNIESFNRRNLLKFTGLIAAGSGLIGLGGIQYATRIEPEWVEISNIPIRLTRLHPAFNGYRIVQISDIHMNAWMNHARLARLVKTVNRLMPDLIVITGDFISCEVERYAGDMTSALQSLSSPDGILAVLGNHDHWSNPDLIREALLQAGIRELRNQTKTIHREQAELHIGGIDSSYEGHDRLDQVLDHMNGHGAAILLAHEPDFADISSATGRIDLQLSGHSHGGQVVLPWIGSPFLPPHGRKYPRGLYQVDKMVQYTNRGLGTTSYRVRINCRPEITMFTLASCEPV